MATIYRTNGDVEELEGTGPNRTVTLEQCQKAVGGYIEAVRMPGAGKRLLVVHENGRLVKSRVNELASKLARQVIVGDALVVTPDDDGNWY